MTDGAISGAESRRDLGEGPIILEEREADLLREKINDDLKHMDQMAEEYRELEEEFRDYRYEAEFKLHMNRGLFLALGIAIGGGLAYVL